MDITIDLGTEKDIDELEQLYDALNDYLEIHTNYPGWKKGIYPVRQDAAEGIKGKYLYTAKYQGKIVGSIILNHHPEPAYQEVKWQVEAGYSEIIVIHTFLVHPEYLKCGIGKGLMDFALEMVAGQGMKAIRLDVYENNLPAIQLYEKCGCRYIGKVDLGLREYGLDWFKLYEKVLCGA